MIGIIGIGGVARYAHLPAYRASGLDVVALCDVDLDLCQRVALEFGVAHTFSDPQALMAHPAVKVLDIATPPSSHRELLTLAARHGKPVLVQKPLCTDRDDFAAIAALERQGLRVRLNLTGRHVSAWRKIHDLIGQGSLGQPVLCTIFNRDWWDRERDRWEHTITDYIVFEMVIHHLDLCLFWFGLPRAVTARGGRHPAQILTQRNWSTVMLDYPHDFAVQIVDDWTMSEFAFASGHPFEHVLISGANGAIRANSERIEFAQRGTNTMQVWHLPRPGQSLPGETLPFGWFPSSFGRAMIDFISTLDTPRVAAADWQHLRDLTALTFAVSDAMESARWQTIEPCASAGSTPRFADRQTREP
jgi:predicted dehydrogenase